MMVRKPQIKDVIILDEKKYVIRAMIADENSTVLTLVEGPNSRTFVLLGARLDWQDTLQAWRPESIADFFETDEVALDSDDSRERLAVAQETFGVTDPGRPGGSQGPLV